MSESPYATMTGREIRARCRTGAFDRPTAGAALGFTQVNLVVLRGDVAGDFEDFCRLNPKPCPLLEVLDPGQYEPVRMAPGADVRNDLPRYRVYRDGVCVDRPTSIDDYWAEAAASAKGEFIAFLIGCSFTFESALLAAGVPVRHVEENCNVPMYRTNIACMRAGVFEGPLIVSMRPMTPEQAILAAKITAEFPGVHGEPVHTGEPATIGIADLASPDYGDAVTIKSDEVPVYWACGVTPMEAIIRAKLDIAVTHDPGHMLVTDVRDESLRES